jgi:tetratricopeptide (TPR) repeat protein
MARKKPGKGKKKSKSQSAPATPSRNWSFRRIEGGALPEEYLAERDPFRELMTNPPFDSAPDDFDVDDDYDDDGYDGDEDDDTPLDGPRQMADELAVAAGLAFSAGDIESAVQLAEEAVRHHPQCVDARALLLGQRESDLKKRIEGMREILRDAERDFGEEFFNKYRGVLGKRKAAAGYLSARRALGALLQEAGRDEEAIEEWEALLASDMDDTVVVRFPLLIAYLRRQRREEAERLCARFEEDWDATWDWARVLERYLAGDLMGASIELENAREMSPEAEALLSGSVVSLVSRLPDDSFFDDQSSRHINFYLGEEWRRHPDLIEWVKSVPRGNPPPFPL